MLPTFDKGDYYDDYDYSEYDDDIYYGKGGGGGSGRNNVKEGSSKPGGQKGHGSKSVYSSKHVRVQEAARVASKKKRVCNRM